MARPAAAAAEQIHHRNEITQACRTPSRHKLTVVTDVVVVVVARQTAGLSLIHI